MNSVKVSRRFIEKGKRGGVISTVFAAFATRFETRVAL